MPAIADPYRDRPYDAPVSPSRDNNSDGSHSLRLRLRTARRRAELTRELARGTNPSASPELAPPRGAAHQRPQPHDHRSQRRAARFLRRTSRR